MRMWDYKRKDGRWEAVVVYADPDTGEDVKKSFYCNSKRGSESKRERNKFAEKIEAGDYSDICKLTVEGWLNKFLAVYCANKAQTTKDGYKNYIDNHIVPFIGKLKLNKIKPINIQKFYNSEREKGFSEKTILQEHRILHRAFKIAVVNRLMSMNPCDGVDAPSPEEYKPTIYSEEQYNTLLKKLENHRMEAIILLAGMCGLRRAELLGLCWEDIEFSTIGKGKTKKDIAVIHVRNTQVPTSVGIITKEPKNKTSFRNVAVPSIVVGPLKRLRGIGKIYTKTNGQDYNPGSVSRMFNTFLEDNGLPHIRLHDLRHFNATMMLKYGVTEREVSERLGHSNLLMSKKYQHVVGDMDQVSADKLNSVYRKQN